MVTRNYTNWHKCKKYAFVANLSPKKIKLSPKILESIYLSIDIDLATNLKSLILTEQVDKYGNDVGYDKRLEDIKIRYSENSQTYLKCHKLINKLKEIKKYENRNWFRWSCNW